ncbi:MAG: Ku protein [Actinomycetota bacterium]|nr:Ku protein [Actinomycetota bacterium]
MPRAVWTGSISFGLVNVPVKLFSATESHQVHFRQFDPESGEHVRYQRVTEKSGEEVDYDDIVKGYELDDGRYVLVTPEELASVEPGRSRSIEIEDFIDLDAVDPIWFDRSYHLAPADETAAKPYTLLQQAMEDAGRVAIARFVMRTKQYLGAIRPSDGHLVLETMYFADEVRDPADIDEMEPLQAGIDVTDRERDAAVRLIDSLTSDWDPTRYQDTYRERVLDLIERKAEGEDIVTDRPEEPVASVSDLMSALEASVEEARQRSGSSSGRSGPTGDDTGDDLDSMSKDELYAQAQERDIAGRSSMSKDELAAALRTAS